MKRLSVFVIFVCAIVAFSVYRYAYAADITEVADAADENDPFDLEIELNYSYYARHSLLRRERNVLDVRGGSIPGESINQGEYDYWGTAHKMNIALRIGLYKDLEFHVFLPVVFTKTDKFVQSKHWRKKYWGGSVYTGKPSLYEEGLVHSVRDEFGTGEHLDDITIGFAYAPFNSARDATKPTWKLLFDITLPTAKLHDPRELNLEQDENSPLGWHENEPNLGEKLLTFTLGTVISRRYTAVDPYIGLLVDLPVPVGDSLIEKPQNKIRSIIGAEFIVWEKPKPDSFDPRHKVYLDMRANITLFTEGDAYPPLTDMLVWQKEKNPSLSYRLPREESFVRAEGMIALKIQAYDFIRFQGFGTIGHDFEHYLAVQTTTASDGRPESGEYYKDITEAGKRVKISETIFWSAGGGIEIAF